MTTSQPLGHLSEAELLELMSRYYAGERVATLLGTTRSIALPAHCAATFLPSQVPNYADTVMLRWFVRDVQSPGR